MRGLLPVAMDRNACPALCFDQSNPLFNMISEMAFVKFRFDPINDHDIQQL